MKIPVIVALDEETHPIWMKMPNQQKSRIVRELIRRWANEEPPNPKQPITKSLIDTSDTSSTDHSSDSKQEKQYLETARTAIKQKQRSSNKPEESIAKQLLKVSRQDAKP